MSGHAGNAAFKSEKTKQRSAFLTLTKTRKMLPLVQRIVSDILASHHKIAQLEPEQNRLERQRRMLDWAGRSRRYRLQDELSAEQKLLQENLGELGNLGVLLLDPINGQVGFPTMVNDHSAFFSWRPGEQELVYWHFVGETVRRQIPGSWAQDESEWQD